jgi:xanthine dehydrogenase accessory factor
MRNTYAIYAELFEKLCGGEEAFLLTECGPAGVTKDLRLTSSVAERIVPDPESDDDSLWIQKKGETTVIEEHFLPHPRMIIFGGGHISVSLSHIASMLDFDVTVFDDRPSFANAGRFPWAREVICHSFEAAAERVAFREGDYAVILTRGHRHDEDCLRAILSGTIPRYMGMIGSRRRVAIVKNKMAAEGYSPESIDKLHSPIGLSIGAVTPEEISVAILAEIIQEKRSLDEHDYRAESYADMELIKWLAEQAGDSRAEPAAIVTIISSRGSTPRESGAKMAVLSDGRLVGTIGGGCAESDVIRDAIDIGRNGGYLFKNVNMAGSAEDDGMVCGGVMEVLIESIGA